jgi:hypothetical protein
VLAETFSVATNFMPSKFRAVARRCYLDSGLPRVGREVVGIYPTRKEAEAACTEFVKAQDGSFRAAYDDCVVELVLDTDQSTPDLEP